MTALVRPPLAALAEYPLRTAIPPLPAKALPPLPVRVLALHARLPPHAAGRATILADVQRRFGPARFAGEAPAPPAPLHRPTSEFPPQLPDKPSAPVRAVRPAEFPGCDHAGLPPMPEFLPARAFDPVPPVHGPVATLDGSVHRRCSFRPPRSLA